MMKWLFEGMEDGWCRGNTIVAVLFVVGVISLYGFIEKF